MATPRYAITYLAANQAGAEVVVNGGFNVVDALTNCMVKDDTLTAPPGSPAEGDTYLVASGGTGAWSGKDGQVAIYFSGWIFVTPFKGLVVYFDNHSAGSKMRVYNGSAWVAIASA